MWANFGNLYIEEMLLVARRQEFPKENVSMKILISHTYVNGFENVIK